MPSRTLAIYLIAACTFAGAAARLFLLPLYANQIGAGRAQVGLLFTTYMAAAALLSIPAGTLADRLGRRWMLVFAVLIGAGSQLACFLTTSVPVLFAWQLLGGLGGAAQAAMFAALADETPADRLGRSMGWLTFSMQTGFLAGPVIAAVGLRWLDLRGDLGATTVLFVIALPLCFLLRGRPVQARASVSLGHALRELRAQPGFHAVVVGVFGSTLLWGTLQAYLPLFGKESLGLAPAQIGYLLTIQAVANGLSRIPGGRLIDRLRRRGPLVFVCMVGFALGIGVLPHLHGLVGPVLLLVATVPLIAILFVALGVLFVSLASEQSRGLAMGVYGTALYCGLGTGPAVFGPIMQSAGYTAGFTACAVAGVLVASVMAAARSRGLRMVREIALPGPARRTE